VRRCWDTSTRLTHPCRVESRYHIVSVRQKSPTNVKRALNVADQNEKSLEIFVSSHGIASFDVLKRCATVWYVKRAQQMSKEPNKYQKNPEGSGVNMSRASRSLCRVTVSHLFSTSQESYNIYTLYMCCRECKDTCTYPIPMLCRESLLKAQSLCEETESHSETLCLDRVSYAFITGVTPLFVWDSFSLFVWDSVKTQVDRVSYAFITGVTPVPIVHV